MVVIPSELAEFLVDAYQVTRRELRDETDSIAIARRNLNKREQLTVESQLINQQLADLLLSCGVDPHKSD